MTGLLQLFGLAVLFSASSLLALQEGQPSTHYVLRQAGGVALGVFALGVCARLDAERWRAWAWPLMLGTMALLVICVLPFTTSIAPRINGSRRWITVGITMQPSELGKLAVVLWTAMLMVKKGERLTRLTKGLLPFLLVVGLMSVLAFLEPDLSIGLTYVLLLGILLFSGNVPIGHFLVLGLLAIPVVWHELERLQYAVLRLLSFLDAGQVPAEASYQLKQSLVAVGSGQIFGVGYGRGWQQSGFLPFPYSDFIGSNVGEEWGVVGMLAVLLGFAAYGWYGFRIAKQARSPFLRLVAIGLTTTTVLTAYLHLGVVVGLLPTTGLTLPLFSYGRTNLVLTLAMTGILINIGSERVFCRSRRERIGTDTGEDLD